MERKERQSAIGYRPFIFLYSLSDGNILFMKNKGNKIVFFTKIIASRFINKDTQISHGQSLIKKPGKTSPALGSPLLRDDHLIYTMKLGVYSSMSIKYKHMFVNSKGGHHSASSSAAKSRRSRPSRSARASNSWGDSSSISTTSSMAAGKPTPAALPARSSKLSRSWSTSTSIFMVKPPTGSDPYSPASSTSTAATKAATCLSSICMAKRPTGSS